MKKYRYSNNALEYLNNGIEKYEIKDFEGAISDFSLAIELDNTLSEAFFLRGLIYGKELHKYKKAIKDFTEAIELYPDYAEAYYNRGVTYRILDDLKKACSDWVKAKNLGYKDAELLINKYCDSNV